MAKFIAAFWYIRINYGEIEAPDLQTAQQYALKAAHHPTSDEAVQLVASMEEGDYMEELQQIRVNPADEDAAGTSWIRILP